MPLRIGFDMDGTIADFESAFHEVELRLFGPVEGGRPLVGPPGQDTPPGQDNSPEPDHTPPPDDAEDDAKERILGARQTRRQRDAVWAAIQATPNFWETLQPLEPDAIRRVHALMLAHHWEVFFITQRPQTQGDTVQRQTQRWLVRHGFDLPSVLVLAGSRGAAAGALRLDYHVDDSAQNCLDVLADSRAKPLLIAPATDDETAASARKLGIGTASSIAAALDILEKASAARTDPGVLTRLASLVGWR